MINLCQKFGHSEREQHLLLIPGRSMMEVYCWALSCCHEQCPWVSHTCWGNLRYMKRIVDYKPLGWPWLWLNWKINSMKNDYLNEKWLLSGFQGNTRNRVKKNARTMKIPLGSWELYFRLWNSNHWHHFWVKTACPKNSRLNCNDHGHVHCFSGWLSYFSNMCPR